MSHATLTTLANEEWRDIKGWEGYYQVSNLGRVRSLDRIIELPCKRWGGYMKRPVKSCIRKQKKSRIDKYVRVILSKNHEEKTYLVHRLVAEAFIPNDNNFLYINHKDENPANNRADNLEWCTCSYNLKYGSHPIKFGMSKGRPVEQMTLDGVVVARYYNAYEAERQSSGFFSKSSIHNVARGRSPQHKGFLWRYAEKQ